MSQNKNVIYVIYSALCLSLIIYGALIFLDFIKGNFTASIWPNPQIASLENIPLLMATAFAMMSFILRFVIFPKATNKINILIVSYAFNEAVGIMGLVGTFLGVPKFYALGFIAAGLILNLIMFPRDFK